MFKKTLLLFFFLSLGLPCRADDYFWPIEGDRLLSSVFGDSRELHFHMGIDIKTGGKTGARILAPADGRVFRLFTSYRGYGKAVYLEAHDGRVFVFGHLSDFSSEASAVAQEEQLKNRKYYVDLFPKGIEVRKGELIGYSGESGLGGPHLHFEIRDQQNRPLNPLTCGFAVSDSVPPVLRKVALGPADRSSTVNGSHAWTILPFHYDEGQKTYILKDTVRVDGKSQLALSVFDKMNKSRHKFGIYQVKLFLDGELLFFSSYDSLSFEKAHKIDLERGRLSEKERNEEFYKLFLEKGNDVGIYPRKSGVIDSRAENKLGSNPKGYHQAEILTCDANRNCARGSFVLLFDSGPAIGQISCQEGFDHARLEVEILDTGEVRDVYLETTKIDSIAWGNRVSSKKDQPGGYSFKLSREPQIVRIAAQDTFKVYSDWKYLMLNGDRISESQNQYAPSSVRCDCSFKEDSFVFYIFLDRFILREPDICLEVFGRDFGPEFLKRIDDTTFYAVIPFDITDRGMAKLVVRGEDVFKRDFQFDLALPVGVISPLTGGGATSPDGEAGIEVDKDGVYQNINLVVGKTADKNKDMIEGTFYCLEPAGTPLNKTARIWLKYPHNVQRPEKIAVYGQNNTNGMWEFAGRELNKNEGTVQGSVRYFSTYALGEDTTPPVIRRVKPRQNQKFKNRRPTISAIVEDDLSGIEDDKDVEMYLDGEWLIPEYDIDSGVLKSRPHFDLSIGKHRLTVKVKDRMGNASLVKREFEVISR